MAHTTEQPPWKAFVLWLTQHPEADVEPLEFLATPEGQSTMPAELHSVIDQLLTYQFVQAYRWHETAPAAVTLTERGRQFARYLDPVTTPTGRNHR